MIVLLFLLIIPAAIYQGMSDRWQSIVLTWTVIVLALAFGLLVIRIAREIRAFGTVRRIAGHHWRAGQLAGDFQLALIHHLQNSGCRILWSRIVDQDRVGFAIEASGARHDCPRAILLCLAPGARPRGQDSRQARLWQAEAAAGTAIMVTDTRPPQTDPAARIMGYEALRDMTAAFETAP